MIVELRADQTRRRYRVRILAGNGAGTEIWTLLNSLSARRTAVEVRYHLPERRADRVAMLAEKYLRSSARLWDEDEAMMIRRETLPARADYSVSISSAAALAWFMLSATTKATGSPT
jgi:hypothetical protein